MTTEPKARPRPKPRNKMDRARPKTEAWLTYDPDDDELPGTSPKPPTEKARWLRAIELMASEVNYGDAIILFTTWKDGKTIDEKGEVILTCGCLAVEGLAITAHKVSRTIQLAAAASILKQNGFTISLDE